MESNESQTVSDEGLMFALRLDGKGRGELLDWKGLRDNWNIPDTVWAHLNYTQEAAQDWLKNESGIEESLAEYLTDEDSRPAVFTHESSLLLILRGINLNKDSRKEDMISIRFWLDRDHIVSLRLRRVHIMQNLKENLNKGKGVHNVEEFILEMLGQLVDEISHFSDEISEMMDDLEADLLEHPDAYDREALNRLRFQAVSLRRYLWPQKEVFAQLPRLPLPWLSEPTRVELRTIAERHLRVVEELEFVRERALIVHEEMENRAVGHLNQRMYVLSTIACIFLPMTLLTGLFGMNVGGIPFSDRPFGFLSVCASMLVGGIIAFFFLKRKKWL
jgi:zinc transporter